MMLVEHFQQSTSEQFPSPSVEVDMNHFDFCRIATFAVVGIHN